MNEKIMNKRLLASVFILIIVSICVLGIMSLNQFIDSTTTLISNSYKKSKLPDFFNEKIFDASSLHYTDVEVSKDNCVIGFSLYGIAEDNFAMLKNKLENNSWSYVDSNSNTLASFFKNDGHKFWLFLNCIQVGSDTSVVMTIDEQ